MKIVINSCYGGFGLSLKAQEEYLKLSGKEAYFYKMSEYKNFKDGPNEYKKEEYKRTSSKSNSLWSQTFTKDFGETFESIPDEDYRKYIFNDYKIERDDPILVSVVESLGKEANGACAELSIVEVPDDIKWFIDEYDGQEHVAEEHSTWY
jgi:hypothetical protein